jgi:hypothetical protein
MSPRPSVGSTVAALRCVVGAGLLGVPSIATNGDADRTVLVRTIGIRDLVVGAGALVALYRNPPAARLWVASGFVSDVADVLLALGSHRQLGARGTLIAAAAPLPFVVAVSCSRRWRDPSRSAT